METNNTSFSNLAAKPQPSPGAGRLSRFWRAAWSISARAGVSLLVLSLWLPGSILQIFLPGAPQPAAKRSHSRDKREAGRAFWLQETVGQLTLTNLLG